MKQITLIITFLCQTLLCAQTSSTTPSKLHVEVNKNIELLGIAYFLGFEGVDIENKTVEVDGKVIPKKEWHNYGFEIYQQFESFQNSNNLYKAFSVADHLWLDYLTAFLLQLEDVPNAEITDSVDSGYYLNFSKEKDKEEALKNARIFVDGLNGFAREIDLDSYMEESEHYYLQATKEVLSTLSKDSFIDAMEQFYKKEFNGYYLIPSLTIPKGMGFGIKNEKNIYSVFGAVDFQEFKDIEKLNMGFGHKDKLSELTIHEFGHSFVNPVVGDQPQDLIARSAHLFPQIKSAMADQGYNTWKVCLYEHFVRAGEIIIAEKTGNLESANRLRSDYINKRSFIYIPEILIELNKYDQGAYENYSQAVSNVLTTLSKK